MTAGTKFSRNAGRMLAGYMVLVSLFALGANAQVGPFGAPPPNVATAATPAKFPNLSWNASLTANVTYDAYRGIAPGGPYGKINAAPITVTSYRDAAASFGVLNYYVVLAKDATGKTSVYSNETSATAVAPTTGSPDPPTQLNAVVAFLEKMGKAIFAALRFLPRHIFG